jgi:hypothetical protein
MTMRWFGEVRVSEMRWCRCHEDEELSLRIWRTKRKSFRRELNVFFFQREQTEGRRKLLLWCYDMAVRWRSCNVGALLLIWQVTWHVTLSHVFDMWHCQCSLANLTCDIVNVRSRTFLFSFSVCFHQSMIRYHDMHFTERLHDAVPD